jgi:hypothetical protein
LDRLEEGRPFDEHTHAHRRKFVVP